jgi:hypothetical protein
MTDAEALKNLAAFSGLKIVRVDASGTNIIIYCKFRKRNFQITVESDGSLTLHGDVPEIMRVSPELRKWDPPNIYIQPNTITQPNTMINPQRTYTTDNTLLMNDGEWHTLNELNGGNSYVSVLPDMQEVKSHLSMVASGS